MIESQFCSMSDEKDFGFEETKSTILDYFELFKEARSTVAVILSICLIQILLFVGIAIRVNDETTATELMGPLLAVYSFALASSISIPIIFYKLFYTSIWKGKKLQKQLSEIQSNLIKRSYLTNFELVEPEIIIQGGDPKLEKFVNHLSLVFTDINKKNKKRVKKGKTVEQHWRWKRGRFNIWKDYFFVTRTKITLYVTQYFEKTITVEDIQKIIKLLEKEKMRDTVTGLKIFSVLPSSIRLIILGEKLDSSFDDENIIQTMNELKRKIKVDIILETEYGYSTVWID